MIQINPSDSYEKQLLATNRISARSILDEQYKTGGLAAIEKIIGEALESIGNKWENGDASLAQVYLAGIITEEIIDSYFTEFSERQTQQPRIGICVLLDYHALGKRLVVSVLKSHGYIIEDYGSGLSVSDMVAAFRDNPVDILLISTLMLSSALKISNLREELIKINPDVKIIPGGAPFRLNKNLWHSVGADGHGENASDAVRIIKELTGGINE